MVATIKDVARLAECSIKTVSRVVNNEPHVTEHTRDRVLEAIETLGYAPNISARRLVQRKSYTICILLHEAGFYQSVVLSKIMEIGYEHDYDILTQTYFPSHAKSKNKLMQLITEHRIDGLVTTPPCDVDDFIAELLKKSNIPLVQITPFNRATDAAYVSGDDYQGAFLMAEHLIALGHRRIAFLAGPRNQRTSLDRLFGYRAALEMHRIPQDEKLVLDSEFNFDGGYTAARIVMGIEARPTAIFGGSDEAALGALYALQEMRIEVPRQVSVCGFDDLAYSKHTWPGLTTVHHPIDEIVEQATYLLLQILSGEEPAKNQVVLPSQLVIRGSTSEPPKDAV